MQLKLTNKPANTIVSNDFIHNCIGAPEGFAAVYLYSLMYSQSHENVDLRAFSARLKMPESEIVEAFEYWQKKGFVKIHNGIELELEFGVFRDKIEDDDLYTESEFFQELQNIFGSRQLSPNDYIKLFDYTSVFMLPKKVVLMLVQYCIESKGKRVSISYIDRAAQSWAEEGIDTEEKAALHIENSKTAQSGIHRVMEQLGLSSRKPTKDEMELYDKWTEEWGFTLSAILTACSYTTASREPSMKYLDGILFRLKQAGSTTSRTISESKTLAENMTKNIQEVLHIMGEKNLTPSAEHKNLYQKWTTAYGYGMEIITAAAEQASKRGRMPFSYIDGILSDWFNNGAETREEVQALLKSRLDLDKKVLAVFDSAGITKMHISDAHRRKYKQWSEDWGMSANTILLAAEISSLKSQPMSYLGSLLSSWHESGVKTVTQAQKLAQKRKPEGGSVGTNSRPTENYDHLAVDLFSDEGA